MKFSTSGCFSLVLLHFPQTDDDLKPTFKDSDFKMEGFSISLPFPYNIKTKNIQKKRILIRNFEKLKSQFFSQVTKQPPRRCITTTFSNYMQVILTKSMSAILCNSPGIWHPNQLCSLYGTSA